MFIEKSPGGYGPPLEPEAAEAADSKPGDAEFYETDGADVVLAFDEATVTIGHIQNSFTDANTVHQVFGDEAAELTFNDDELSAAQAVLTQSLTDLSTLKTATDTSRNKIDAEIKEITDSIVEGLADNMPDITDLDSEHVAAKLHSTVDKMEAKTVTKLQTEIQALKFPGTNEPLLSQIQFAAVHNINVDQLSKTEAITTGFNAVKDEVLNSAEPERTENLNHLRTIATSLNQEFTLNLNTKASISPEISEKGQEAIGETFALKRQCSELLFQISLLKESGHFPNDLLDSDQLTTELKGYIASAESSTDLLQEGITTSDSSTESAIHEAEGANTIIQTGLNSSNISTLKAANDAFQETKQPGLDAINAFITEVEGGEVLKMEGRQAACLLVLEEAKSVINNDGKEGAPNIIVTAQEAIAQAITNAKGDPGIHEFKILTGLGKKKVDEVLQGVQSDTPPVTPPTEKAEATTPASTIEISPETYTLSAEIEVGSPSKGSFSFLIKGLLDNNDARYQVAKHHGIYTGEEGDFADSPYALSKVGDGDPLTVKLFPASGDTWLAHDDITVKPDGYDINNPENGDTVKISPTTGEIKLLRADQVDKDEADDLASRTTIEEAPPPPVSDDLDDVDYTDDPPEDFDDLDDDTPEDVNYTPDTIKEVAYLANPDQIPEVFINFLENAFPEAEISECTVEEQGAEKNNRVDQKVVVKWGLRGKEMQSVGDGRAMDPQKATREGLRRAYKNVQDQYEATLEDDAVAVMDAMEASRKEEGKEDNRRLLYASPAYQDVLMSVEGLTPHIYDLAFDVTDSANPGGGPEQKRKGAATISFTFMGERVILTGEGTGKTPRKARKAALQALAAEMENPTNPVMADAKDYAKNNTGEGDRETTTVTDTQTAEALAAKDSLYGAHNMMSDEAFTALIDAQETPEGKKEAVHNYVMSTIEAARSQRGTLKFAIVEPMSGVAPIRQIPVMIGTYGITIEGTTTPFSYQENNLNRSPISGVYVGDMPRGTAENNDFPPGRGFGSKSVRHAENGRLVSYDFTGENALWYHREEDSVHSEYNGQVGFTPSMLLDLSVSVGLDNTSQTLPVGNAASIKGEHSIQIGQPPVHFNPDRRRS